MTMGGTNQENIAHTSSLGGSARPSLPQAPGSSTLSAMIDKWARAPGFTS